MRYAIANCMTEWAYATGKRYADPFAEVELSVRFTDPDGEQLLVPAFWAGGHVWRVRYASPKTGRHRYKTICSDTHNGDLHGLQGELIVRPYEGDNPLLKHGPLRVSATRRYLEHADRTPFFWLADTWWMGLCERLGWPGDFQRLAADRVAKGFSVVQIVAGLYPDMPHFDKRGANEAGFPWENDNARINPAYFDMADLRLDWLVGAGLLPCIVGCWGYYLPWLGLEKMKQHWRTLVARYGAHPVVWCLAGEGPMPWYLSKDRDGDRQLQIDGWTEIARYVRQIDPFHRPITIHPSTSARASVADPSVLDFDMLQTGHGDRRSLPNTVRLVTEAYGASPRLPVINGEVCYEGIGGACREEVQRLMFWASILSGACGHTYGANGIWQVNTAAEPYGPSPHGMAWGNTPWDEASQLPGSTQVGLAKGLLTVCPWWLFEPHPEWVEPHWTEDDPVRPFCAGVPGKVRIIYIPNTTWPVTVKGVEPDVSYKAFLFDPVTAKQQALDVVMPDADGNWPVPLARPPIFQDWVLALVKQ